MRLSATVIAISLLIAACSGAPPAASPEASPTFTPTGPLAEPTDATVEPTPMPAASTPTPVAPATPPPGLGPVGPVYTGDLASAIPSVVGGEALTVVPVSLAQWEEEGWGFFTTGPVDLLDLMVPLGIGPDAVEIAVGYNEGSRQIGAIVAMRFRGADSIALDSALLSTVEQAAGVRSVRVVSVAGRNVRAYDVFDMTIYAWVNGDIVFALSGSEQGAVQAIASMPLPTVALQLTNGERTAQADILLTLTGGEHAGTYQGVAEDGGCSRNASGDNSFGLQYSTVEPGVEFSSLQLIIRDAAAANGGETEEFYATVEIGPLFSGTTYRLVPEDGEGTGHVAMEDDGLNYAVIEITGTTDEGVGVQATVTCHSVFDFGS